MRALLLLAGVLRLVVGQVEGAVAVGDAVGGAVGRGLDVVGDVVEAVKHSGHDARGADGRRREGA